MKSQTLKGMLAGSAVALIALACTPADRDDDYMMDSAAGNIALDVDWLKDSIRTDEDILGALEETNRAEVEAGKLARDRASDSGVRAFAAKMVDAHTRMMDKVDSSAKAWKIDIDDAPDAQERAHEAALDSLEDLDRDSVAIGASTFDRLYIAQQVAGHKRALELVDAAIGRATNKQFLTMLQTEVRPAVEMHLNQAQQIESRISGGAVPVARGVQ